MVPWASGFGSEPHNETAQLWCVLGIQCVDTICSILCGEPNN